MSKRKIIRKGFFKLNWGILFLAAIIYGLDIILIISMFSFFEGNSFASKFINIIIFPVNFIFSLVGFRGQIAEVLSFGLEFFYAYFLACLFRRLLQIRVRI